MLCNSPNEIKMFILHEKQTDVKLMNIINMAYNQIYITKYEKDGWENISK